MMELDEKSEVITVYPVGNMNVWTKFYGYPSKGYRNIPVLTNTGIPTFLSCLLLCILWYNVINLKVIYVK